MHLHACMHADMHICTYIYIYICISVYLPNRTTCICAPMSAPLLQTPKLVRLRQTQPLMLIMVASTAFLLGPQLSLLCVNISCLPVHPCIARLCQFAKYIYVYVDRQKTNTYQHTYIYVHAYMHIYRQRHAHTHTHTGVLQSFLKLSTRIAFRVYEVAIRGLYRVTRVTLYIYIYIYIEP